MLIEPAPLRPPSHRSRLRAVLGIAAIPVLLVGVVAVALATRPSDPPLQSGVIVSPPDPSPVPTDPDSSLTPGTTPAPSAIGMVAFPDTILGLPVRSVTETLKALDAGEIDGLAAIAGYLTLIGPTEDCPGLEGARNSSALFCRRETLFADTTHTPFGEEERGDIWAPVGPHLHPIAMPGTYLPAVSTLSIPLERRVPGAVVVLGRFDDPRLGACDMRHLRCDPPLSIEWVPWAAGSLSPPSGAFEPELRRSMPMLQPRELREVRLAAVPESGTMLELLVRPDTLERIDPVAWQDLRRPAVGNVWYLRLLDPTGGLAGDRSFGVAWLVIDDATGEVIGSGASQPFD